MTGTWDDISHYKLCPFIVVLEISFNKEMLLALSYCFPLCPARMPFCTRATIKHGLSWFAHLELELSSPQNLNDPPIAQALNFLSSSSATIWSPRKVASNTTFLIVCFSISASLAHL